MRTGNSQRCLAYVLQHGPADTYQVSAGTGVDVGLVSGALKVYLTLGHLKREKRLTPKHHRPINVYSKGDGRRTVRLQVPKAQPVLVGKPYYRGAVW